MSKKPTKAGKKEPAAPPPVDPQVDLKSLQTVTEHLAKAKQNRNFYQLERDKINKFWEISKKELENLRFELANSDHDLEEAESRHQVEMKVYKQKVRHLLYEHKMQVQDIRSQSDGEILQSTDEHQKMVESLKQQKRELHLTMMKRMAENDERMTTWRADHDGMISKTKPEYYKKSLKDTQSRYEQKLALLKDELELRRRAEIHEIEERKNEHINELVQQHQKAFTEMKSYYNHITSNNLDLIKSLKEEIANMKRNDEHNESLMFDIDKENKNLDEPLENAKREVDELQLKLHNYEKDKLSLRNTRSRLTALGIEYAELQESHKALEKNYGEVKESQQSIVRKFESALHDASDVVHEQNTALQQRLLEVGSRVEQRDAQLSSVLAAANLEPATLEVITRKLEDVLETKNRAIKDLHFELRKIVKQHDDVVAEYSRRCAAAHLPPLDLQAIL